MPSQIYFNNNESWELVNMKNLPIISAYHHDILDPDHSADFDCAMNDFGRSFI